MKPLRFSIPLIASLVIATAHHSAADINVVQNGDFSANASSFNGLGYFGGSDPSTLPHYDVSQASGGLGGYGTSAYENFSPAGYANTPANPPVYLFLQGNGGYVTQALTLQPLTYYKLTFEGGGRSGYGNVMGEASISDAGLLSGTPTFTFTNDGSTDFTTYTTTFTTGTDVSDALLTLSNVTTGGGDHTVDFANVSLTVAPEPATFSLLGLGAGALFLVARLRVAKATLQKSPSS